MTKEEYGEKFQEHLLEQYKIIAAQVRFASNKRDNTNRFYISLLSALLLGMSYSVKEQSLSNLQTMIIASASLIGAFSSMIWTKSINSLGVISSYRYDALIGMEGNLPYPCFSAAWKNLQEDKKYVPVAKLERVVPLLFFILYASIFFYALYQLLL